MKLRRFTLKRAKGHIELPSPHASGWRTTPGDGVAVHCRSLLVCAMLLASSVAHAATINQSLCVRTANKTMSDGQSVTFWGYTSACGMGTTGQLPGPLVEIGVGDTLNLTLSTMMAPMEPTPYMGHTVHLHGADVTTAEDGVPETGASVMGDVYTWAPSAEMAGTYMYHCHVHTVKHLEMGMYGPMIVRPKNAAGTAFLNQLTPDAATAYDYVQTYLISSVDPAYHTATGDSPVFADYNPKYFLINGAEGKTTAAPAQSLTSAINRKVALRVIGLHSIHGSFSVRDSTGALKPFTVYVRDGRQYATPETVTSLDVGPGQRYDIIFNTPGAIGAWYPQFEYRNLRDNSAFATVYGRVVF